MIKLDNLVDDKSLEKQKRGRPLKSGYKQQMWDKFVAPEAEKLIKHALKMALDGDETLTKFFVERIIPKAPVHELLHLSGSAGNQMKQLLNYFIEGNISADDTVKVGSVIEKSAMMNYVKQLEERLKQLETMQESHMNGETINGQVDRGKEKENT